MIRTVWLVLSVWIGLNAALAVVFLVAGFARGNRRRGADVSHSEGPAAEDGARET